MPEPERQAPAIDVVGCSRRELEERTKHLPRRLLLDLFHRYVTLEPKFTPEEFGQAYRLGPRAVKALIKGGKLGALKPMENGYRIPLSAALAFNARAAVRLRSDAEEPVTPAGG